MLDLTSLRKRLPEHLAHMSDEDLRRCVDAMRLLADLAIDGLKNSEDGRKNQSVIARRRFEKFRGNPPAAVRDRRN